MIVENTKKNQSIKQVVSSMDIEDMYLRKEFVVELIKVAKGEKSSEQLRQEVIRKYAGQ